MSSSLTRRQWLQRSAAGVTTGLAAIAPVWAGESAAITPPEKRRFGYCFNTSCVRKQNPGLVREIELVSKAGYNGIEPWIREIEDYVKAGGSLSDLKKRLDDLGLGLESAIGFAQWIAEDDEVRKQALEQAKREMDMLAQLGGKRIAAPPAGATREPRLDLFQIAQRYHALLEVGRQTGVVPQLEIWGPSTNLSRIGEAVFVASESAHPDACLLLDVYHIYKGGSDFTGLKMINGRAMHVLHINDYPADPPRETIGDRDRVYPGDGIAPLNDILRTLRDTGYTGMLSLELFNEEYYKQEPATVIETGLQKIDAAVRSALG